MSRYFTVKKPNGELICSIDTETGECICMSGVTVSTDDFEEIFEEKDGKLHHAYNDH